MKKVIQNFIMVLFIFPIITSADVTIDLAQARQAMVKNNYSQANYYYFKILSIQPDNTEAQYGLAQGFAYQRDYQRARTELDKLFVLDSRHQEGLLLSASLNLNEKEYLSALRDAQLVIQQNPDSSLAYMYMSSAYAGIGDETASKQAMDRFDQLSSHKK